MADPIRPLTLSDLWLPGDVLGVAMLREGACVDVATGSGWAEGCIIDTNGGGEPYVVSYFRSSDGYVVDEYQRPNTLRLDFTRPEVRDRAVRILGPDALPTHAAEIRGDITAAEAAGLVWCNVLRKAAGLRVDRGMLGSWLHTPSDSLWTWHRRSVTHSSARPAAWVGVHGWDLIGIIGGGKEIDVVGRTAADAAALAAGYSLREPGGILHLPLPDGVVGRLDTRQ